MKTKLILSIATLLVLAIAAFAVTYGTRTGGSIPKAACSCCKGDSCPMKKKDAVATAEANDSSRCDDCDCCKNGSCPMHKAGEAKDMRTKGMESCPMHKAEGEAMHHASMADGTSCDCSCGKHNKEKKDSESAV